MTLRKLDKFEWHAYCQVLSKDLAANRSESVTASLAVNHETIARWVPLLGIAYEPKEDLFALILRDIDHWVHRPVTLYVDEGARGVTRLEIFDARGLRHTVSLSRPIGFNQKA